MASISQSPDLDKIKTDANFFHIGILGGSTSAGWPYHQYVNIGSFVQAGLGEINGKKIQIDNYSQPGFPIEKTVKKYFSSVKYKPDLLVLYTGQNEYFAYYPTNGHLPIWYKLLQKSLIGKLLINYIYENQMNLMDDSYKGNFLYKTPMPYVIKNYNLLRFEQYAKRLISHCKKYNIAILFIIPTGNALFSPTRSYIENYDESIRNNILILFKQAYKYKYINKNLAAAEKIFKLIISRYALAQAYHEYTYFYYNKNMYNEADYYFEKANDSDDKTYKIKSSYQNSLKRICQKNKIPFLNVKEIIKENFFQAVPDYSQFLDGHHLNFRMYCLLAKQIIIFLQHNYRINSNRNISEEEIYNKTIELFKISKENFLNAEFTQVFWFIMISQMKYIQLPDIEYAQNRFESILSKAKRNNLLEKKSVIDTINKITSIGIPALIKREKEFMDNWLSTNSDYERK